MFSRLRIILLLTVATVAQVSADEASFDKVRGAMVKAHGASLKSPEKIQTYNLLFLKAHKARVTEEINALKKQRRKGWRSDAIKAEISSKKKTLRLVQKAWKKLVKDSRTVERFRTLNDVYAYNMHGNLSFDGDALSSGIEGSSAAGFSSHVSKSMGGGGGSFNGCMNMNGCGPDPMEVVENPFEKIAYYAEKKPELYKQAIEELEKQGLCVLENEPMDENTKKQLRTIIKRLELQKFEEQELADFDEELRASAVPFSTEIDISSMKEEQKKFLKDVGIDGEKFVLPTEVDLSEKFHAPQNQKNKKGGWTKSCTAFAVTADMEFTGDTPVLSKWLAYSMVGAAESADTVNWTGAEAARPGSKIFESLESALNEAARAIPDNMRKEFGTEIDEGVQMFSVFSTLKTQPIPTEKEFSFGEPLPKSLKKVRNRDYSIETYSGVDLRDTANRIQFLRLLVAQGKPPQVVINGEARTELEDWIEPESSDMMHIVNIVGYGEAIDPFDLKRKPYFLIRDSLGTKPIHYKVDAEKFADEVVEAYKITKVKVARKK